MSDGEDIGDLRQLGDVWNEMVDHMNTAQARMLRRMHKLMRERADYQPPANDKYGCANCCGDGCELCRPVRET